MENAQKGRVRAESQVRCNWSLKEIILEVRDKSVSAQLVTNHKGWLKYTKQQN